MGTSKRESTIKKHQAMVTFFNNLFDVKRKRYDDSIDETATRFFCSKATVEKVLREANKA